MTNDLVNDTATRFVCTDLTGACSGVSWTHKRHARKTQLLNCCHLMFRSQMGVTNGHLNSLVSHELLNGSKVNPGHYKPTRERVPQTVPRKAPNDRFS